MDLFVISTLLRRRSLCMAADETLAPRLAVFTTEKLAAGTRSVTTNAPAPSRELANFKRYELQSRLFS